MTHNYDNARIKQLLKHEKILKKLIVRGLRKFKYYLKELDSLNKLIIKEEQEDAELERMIYLAKIVCENHLVATQILDTISPSFNVINKLVSKSGFDVKDLKFLHRRDWEWKVGNKEEIEFLRNKEAMI